MKEFAGRQSSDTLGFFLNNTFKKIIALTVMSVGVVLCFGFSGQKTVVLVCLVSLDISDSCCFVLLSASFACFLFQLFQLFNRIV